MLILLEIKDKQAKEMMIEHTLTPFNILIKTNFSFK